MFQSWDLHVYNPLTVHYDLLSLRVHIAGVGSPLPEPGLCVPLFSLLLLLASGSVACLVAADARSASLFISFLFSIGSTFRFVSFHSFRLFVSFFISFVSHFVSFSLQDLSR